MPPFERARAVHAMRPGVITCPPDASMGVVARIMAREHVHAVVVTGVFNGRPWGVVTDTDVLRAAATAAHQLAGTTASGELLTVSPGEALPAVAELMLEHGATHVMVVDREHDLPLGIISTLDVARVAAGSSRPALTA